MRDEEEGISFASSNASASSNYPSSASSNESSSARTDPNSFMSEELTVQNSSRSSFRSSNNGGAGDNGNVNNNEASQNVSDEYPIFGLFSSSVHTAWTDVISALQEEDLTASEKEHAFLHQGATGGFTIYHWAIRLNAPVDVVSILIEEGSVEAISKADHEGITPLNMACWEVAPFEIVDLFLKAAPDAIHTVDSDEFNALHSAAKRNPSPEVMRALVGVGGKALVQKQTTSQRSTLFLACDEDSCILENIQLLVEVGGNDLLFQEDEDGRTPLYDVCYRNEPRLDIIRYLLEVGKQELALRSDNTKQLPLHIACLQSKSVELVSLLLEAGGKDTIDFPDINGFTPFMNACRSGGIHSLQILKMLIDKGGKDIILRRSDDGSNVLHLACCRDQPQMDVVRFLVNIVDATLFRQTAGEEAQYTPLHGASRNMLKDVIQVLVDVGGKQLVSIPDSFNHTPLHWALMKRPPKERFEDESSDNDLLFSIVEYLLDSMDPEELLSNTNNYGDTPLHTACWNKTISLKLVNLFVEKAGKGAFLKQNHQGMTPLLIACWRSEYVDVIESALLDAGGYEAANIADVHGRLPLHHLFMNGTPIELIARFISIGGEESLLHCDEQGNNAFFYRTANWMNDSSRLNISFPRKDEVLRKIWLNEVFITSGLWKCLLDLYIQVFVLIIFSFIIPTFARPDSESIPYWCLYSLAIILFYQGLTCLKEIMEQPALNSKLFSIRKVLALCHVILLCFVLVSHLQNDLTDLGQTLVLVTTSVVVWLNLLSKLTLLSYNVSILVRVLGEVGIFSIMILLTFQIRLFLTCVWSSSCVLVQVFIKLVIPLFLIIAAILLSLTYVIHINAIMNHDCSRENVELQEFESFCNIGYSYLSMIGLLLNDLSMVHLDFSTPDAVILITISALFSLSIFGTLLSFVVNNITNKAYEKAAEAFWNDRFEILFDSLYSYRIGLPKNPIRLSSLRYVRVVDDTAEMGRVAKWFNNQDAEDTPPFRSRFKIIRKIATFDDLIFPGKDLEILLMGQKSVIKQMVIRLLIWIMFPFILVYFVVVFVVGFITLGLLWPRWIKESLFLGPIECDRSWSGKLERNVKNKLIEEKNLNQFKEEFDNILRQNRTEDLETQKLERIQFKDDVLRGVQELMLSLHEKKSFDPNN